MEVRAACQFSQAFDVGLVGVASGRGHGAIFFHFHSFGGIYVLYPVPMYDIQIEFRNIIYLLSSSKSSPSIPSPIKSSIIKESFWNW